MNENEYNDLQNTINTALTTSGELQEDGCIRIMCECVISQPYSITPSQLASLMDLAKLKSHDNIERWLKIPPRGKHKWMKK